MTQSNPESLLAKGGGNAAAAGIAFQSNLAALFAAYMLSERPLDGRLRLGNSRAISLRLESEAPVDDILVATDKGFVFVQAKTSLNLSKSATSELGGVIEQIVRQWLASASGGRRRGWDRPLNPLHDRILIAVGPGSSKSISTDLAASLTSRQGTVNGALNEAQRDAGAKFENLINLAWKKIEGRDPDPAAINALLGMIVVLQFDFGGPDRTAGAEVLRPILGENFDADTAFATLAHECTQLMSARRGSDTLGFRELLSSRGVPLLAPPSFQRDVTALRTYSDRIRSHLEHYEETKVGVDTIRIDRACTVAVMDAATRHSLVLVGEPGAGKSAVISSAAARLRQAGHEVLELAVDRLPVESLDGLRIELSLSHSVGEVLRNWPGDQPAFLFIDALDATRGGKSETVFRALISDILDIPGHRWRVIASIRTFDLRLGKEFRELFHGSPPTSEYADPSFPNIRHIHVPLWTEAELAEFLQNAPAIATAIDHGGPRLRDLALVPFNTRLLADLVSGGLAPDAFGNVLSQVELLALYWDYRVSHHGVGAELCLRNAVAQMVAAQSLRADRLQIAEAAPSALDALLSENVLILVAGDRYISFRHHILFDYAASRLYLSPSNLTETSKLLRREQGLGLMLGPALVFALQDLWSRSGDTRDPFWQVIVEIAGDSGSDPIARSIAARLAAELPTTALDLGGLARAIVASGDFSKKASVALAHIVGALAVRAEDKQSISVEAWSSFAASISGQASAVAWPLRTLLYVLIERRTSEQDASLGLAARRLLEFSLRDGAAGNLAVSAIGFVGDTYASDPAASRELLRSLFDPNRFEKHGHEDIPWLTRKLDPIARTDPEFVAEIYRLSFAERITDTSETSMGRSQILPLLSNRRQDYDMAQWSLKEFFPKFLETHPEQAAIALVDAIEGYVSRSHPISDSTKAWRFEVDGRDVELTEDWSHIWASDPDEEHGDNAVSMLRSLVGRLEAAPEGEAIQIARAILGRNRLAVIWSRLFLAGAKRAQALGHVLWPYAIKAPFLISSDTRKDAIDLIASQYPSQSQGSLEAFERDALDIRFLHASDPARARTGFLLQLFHTIGKDRLSSTNAKALLEQHLERENSSPVNERPVKYSITSGPAEDYWWLTHAGVDLEAAPNSGLLRAIQDARSELGIRPSSVLSADDVKAAWASTQKLRSDIDQAVRAGAAGLVTAHAFGVLGECAVKIASLDAGTLQKHRDVVDGLVPIIEELARRPEPEAESDVEAKFENSGGWGSPASRIEAAEAAMPLCRVDEITVERLQPTLEALLGDRHPAVRLSIAQRLNTLWITKRSLLWELAQRVAERETNRGVLSFFANHLLGRLLHSDPERIEALVLQLQTRAGDRKEKPAEQLLEQIGGLIGLLWVSHGRDRARQAIESWLRDVPTYEEEVSHAISAIRGALILGYDSGADRDIAIRRRSHEFASWTIEACASDLERYLAQEGAGEEDRRRATLLAKTLNQVGDQFYFASGAFRERRGEEAGLTTNEAKRSFLNDVSPMLRRLGDVGTPGTIHHLIELLEFLMPADPQQVFDLVAHALLAGGRRHGYQFESLGAERVVVLIGQFLADHRELFADPDRRQTLVACLDAFIEAGWPSARRLLYRLPELLQ